ncbi:MAG: hypothetical protein COA50_16305 [Flavobacteriaceae bacterium]|nr:MAG: hypothetical protein COA50_16305 [Flavobacteriaceae bacterium]
MKKLTLLFTVLLLLNGCSKEIANKNENQEEQHTENQENVVAILKDNSQITSSDTDLSNGIYSIEFSGDLPEIGIDDIIVGNIGEGFLRKVISASTNGNTITMQTVQANMEDVFKDAVIEFNTDLSNSAKIGNIKYEKYKINYLAKGVQVSENGFEFDFSNTVLYEKGALTFKITDGTATFNPNFSFKGEYSLFGGLDYLDFKTNNAELNLDLNLSLNASAGVSLPELSKTLADIEKKITFPVTGVPVVVIVKTTLVAELSANINSSFDFNTGLTNNYIFSTSAKYENDSWSGNFDLNSSLTPKPINMEGEVNITQNLTITPRVSVKFYGVIGPYCQPKMTEDFTFNIASPSLDWDSSINAGLDVKTGVDITIFGYDVADFSRNDNFEETVWNAPETLEIVSGNNQTGKQGQQLTEPLKVLVKDKLENTFRNVPIYFSVTQGNGTVDNESVMTDENGFAEVLWTLGENTDLQAVKVIIKKADGTIIESSPLTFNASSEDDLSGALEIVSGNNQTGVQGQQLTEPLKVLVKDKFENTLSNIHVSFSVTQGNGTVDNESILTDENGFAEVLWTLGENTDPQTVKAIIKKADGTTIESSSVFFNASSDEFDIIGIWMVTDAYLGDWYSTKTICDAEYPEEERKSTSYEITISETSYTEINYFISKKYKPSCTTGLGPVLSTSNGAETEENLQIISFEEGKINCTGNDSAYYEIIDNNTLKFRTLDMQGDSSNLWIIVTRK